MKRKGPPGHHGGPLRHVCGRVLPTPNNRHNHIRCKDMSVTMQSLLSMDNLKKILTRECPRCEIVFMRPIWMELCFACESELSLRFFGPSAGKRADDLMQKRNLNG